MAEAGKLIFVIAGPTSATDKIAPYLKDVMGRSVISMGTDVSKSSMLKIAGNICVVSFMEVISEAHVFAEKVGLGFDVQLAMKDARHALNCAKSAGTRLEVSEVALAHMEKATELVKDAPLDSSSMYGTIRVDAGLDFYTDVCKARDGKK